MNIRDVLRTLNIEFREHGESGQVSHGWVGLCCPHCSGGTGKFKCGINRSLAVSCFTCGRHKLGETLARAAGVPLRDILPLLVGLGRDGASGDDWKPSKPAGTLKLPDDVGELQPIHRRYLEKRGYDPNVCSELWGVRGIGMDGGKFKWRILFPVLNDGKIASYQARAISPDVQPRYRAADPQNESVPLKHMLAGEQHCRHCVIVTEGYFQAMRIGPGAVATLGVGYTEHQLFRIAQYPMRVILFDREYHAQLRASKLADSLSVFPGETYVVCMSGPQPDSSPPEEIAELRRRFLE